MVSFSRFVFLACVAVACVAGLQATSADARVLSELKGGVAGGSILQGVLRMGQEVEVRRARARGGEAPLRECRLWC